MPSPRGRGRPPNEAHRSRRREQILDLAAKVFAERGYPGTDLQLVADELGIGKGTVYRYFPSKRELFLATADRGMQLLLRKLEEDSRPIADPLGQVAQGVRSYLAFFDRHPEYIELLIQERAVFRERKHPTYFRYRGANDPQWKEFFRELMRSGRIRKTRVEDVLNGLGDLLYGTIFTNHFARRKERLEVQARRVLNVVFLGILTEKERRNSRGEDGI